MEQKAKLDSASEITSQYDATQINLEGSFKAYGRRGHATILNVYIHWRRILCV